MIRGNTIRAALVARRNAVTASLYQYDYGQILNIVGLELPFAFEVHFTNEGGTQTKTVIGRDGQVDIPDEYLLSGKNINAYLYLHTGENDGETEYKITIPVKARAKPSDTPPTPVQQDAITQAIAALNDAVEQTGADVIAADAAKEDAEAARDRAEAAQDKAETAQGKAEDAQTLAEAARDRAEAARDRAITAEGNAATDARAASDSAERAEQAAANAGYLDVEIDENGHLIYIRTDAVDVDFSLRDGHLWMEAI